MKLCRPSRSIVVCLATLILSGCARKHITAWLQCAECTQEELHAVLRLDERGVRQLRRALLEGLPAGQRLKVRVQLASEYKSLKRYLSEEGKRPLKMQERDFVDLHLLRADEHHRIQAARALARIGGDEARAALVDVLKQSPSPSASVVRSAGEALKQLDSDASDPIEGFLGTWNNEDGDTRSWTRLVLRADKERMYVQMFGACQSSDCDAGEWATPLSDALDSAILLKADHGFAVRYLTLRLIPDQRMQVRTQTHYIDGSGRPDEDQRDIFRQTPAAVGRTP